MPAASISGSSCAQSIGVGTPRGLQGRVVAILGTVWVLMRVASHWLTEISAHQRTYRSHAQPARYHLVSAGDLYHGLLGPTPVVSVNDRRRADEERSTRRNPPLNRIKATSR